MLCSLWGCMPLSNLKPDTGAEPTAASLPAVAETAEPTVPETVPADGNPEDVTCKGSYTGEPSGHTVVARLDGAELTDGELAVWYWAAVAQYRRSGAEIAPDFDRPLDTQVCQLDSSVGSWQQYFLRQALAAWHGSQALMLRAAAEPIPTEEAYQPNATTHARCMTGKPATAFLYGYQKTYAHNTMHQAYLDDMLVHLDRLAQEGGYESADALAEEAFGCSVQTLTRVAQQYNSSYMYLTFLQYDLEVTAQEAEDWYVQNQADYEAAGITRESGNYVDIRHVLLIPEGQSQEQWDACRQQAEKLLYNWQHTTRETEANFAELAYRNSQDTGTAISGGGYSRLRQGQLLPELDAWCFDAARLPGDTTVVTTDQGVHILYFSGAVPVWQAAAEADLLMQRQMAPMAAAKEQYPAQVDYSAIVLPLAAGTVSFGDVLYPDVAHQRYPEVPVYLQQDYPNTWYGNHKISSNGCGITTFAMLTTYMTDQEWTPPEMCDLYGRYSFSNGTDGMIFINEPPVFNYFCRSKTYDPKVAKQALDDGYIVISIQHKGYWTGGGHYILLEKVMEDGLIQVRDSNIANYFKLSMHLVDRHEWKSITSAGSGFWIFEPKVTFIAACSRCGGPEAAGLALQQQDYLCEKCCRAVSRRDGYLTACVQ